MNPKKLIYIGAVILTTSLLAGTFGVMWFINNSFDALERNETAGIGAVSSSIEYALYLSLLEPIGILVGIILIVVGGIKLNNQNKKQN